MHPKGEEVSETNAVADVERLKRQAERWESRARLASAASHSRAVIDQADNDALRAELAELRVKWEQECANLEMAERRVEAAEAEVERLTRDRLDREATETDARERLRRCEERLAAVGDLIMDLGADLSGAQAKVTAVEALADRMDARFDHDYADAIRAALAGAYD